MQETQTEFTPNGEPQFTRLEARRRKEFHYGKDGDKPLNLRLRRSISWLGCAERELYHSAPSDPDVAFTCYWIAFNALYSDGPVTSEEETFNTYFGKIVPLNSGSSIYQALWHTFLSQIRSFVNNQFVYKPFWDNHNEKEVHDDWQEKLALDKIRVESILIRHHPIEDVKEEEIITVLQTVFARMYVLRNQIIHGNATWNSDRNRDQVQDGANIMATLTPVFIDLMMDNPNIDWGNPYYTLPPDVPGVSPIKDN